MAKFNVGDKVRVLDVDAISGGKPYYYDGMKTEVVGMMQGHPILRDKDGYSGVVIVPSEYHAIELVTDEPDRITALETEVAELQAKVDAFEKAKATTVHNVTLNTHQPSDARKFAEALAKALDVDLSPKPRSLTPNERRADVIKHAKAFVSVWEVKCGRKISYVVNTEKRTVVALKHRRFFFQDGEVFGRGIAKCDPSDVFNADIGKAIALGRALGVDVTEFERAVQPTTSVGQRIKLKHCGFATARAGNIGEVNAQVKSGIAWIHEDTDAVYQ